MYGQGSTDNMADADSRCLASLLLLRDIQSSRMHYGNTRQSSEAFPVVHEVEGRGCVDGWGGGGASFYRVFNASSFTISMESMQAV